MKVTAIGGGTGLSATSGALASIGDSDLDLSFIVATTDNGGSTGKIRRWSGCIAWGDLRHVINALSEWSTPSLQAMLFDYRFEANEGELSGHNLGNIILHALETLAPSPQAALKLVTHWFGISAHVIPMSEEVAELSAQVRGQVVKGEVEVDEMVDLPESMELIPAVNATSEAIDAIMEADLIILGPGSVMTSVLPSLLVKGIASALEKSSASKIWVQNIGKEGGPMGGLNPDETHQWLRRILGYRYCDTVLVDSSVKLNNIACNIEIADLADERHPERHSAIKLMESYTRLLKKV
ncbi:YvcK family protein [bacterium]|nr:YvcK family protein [bacterium]